MTKKATNRPLSFTDRQNLIEGFTQKDPSFREAVIDLGIDFEADAIFSELDRTKNRLNYAMLGIHPIYRREVELAGLVDFSNRSLNLMGENIINFDDLDPSYLEFLENQKRIYNVDNVMPLSSVALKSSNLLLKDTMQVPDISNLHMNVPQDLNESSISRRTLEKAFSNSMVIMVHLERELKKHGLFEAYGVNKDQLLQYVGSNTFSNSFEHSVKELDGVAQDVSRFNEL